MDRELDPHLNGTYHRNHPTWHVEFSPWKAQNVSRLLEQKNLRPSTIGEVGCGVGEVLRQLQLRMDPACRFLGYDIAPPAIEMAKERENRRLQFELGDFGTMDTPFFDLLLALEVVDHVEDYLGFLRNIRSRAEWKVFSFSLDISVQSVLRQGELARRQRYHSHLHHFTKETALETLRHTGYEIAEHVFPPTLPVSRLAKLAYPVRRAAFALSEELTTRLFGGYSLLVLAR
ncbi:MAG: class I SAM-dependent methyltransferase [Acidobacteriia bacterium]|nr:class I SAM-dependent methyltransferase [Terriglobia bacterium]